MGLAKNLEKGIESIDEVKDKETDIEAMDEPKKVNSESIEEKKEKIVESDANKSDLSEFTEQRMFDDMNELKRIGKIDATKCTKKKLRQMLEQKYNLKKRALKEH